MSPSPIRRGVTLAFAAAALFGATAPLVQRASAGVGSLAAAALLYLGAGLAALALMAGGRPQGRLGGRAVARLAVIALVGAALAPTLLVLGLKRTDAATGSLLLVLEAPFTLVLAALLLGERLSGRVVAAMVLIAAGSLALTIGAAPSGRSWTGPLLIAGATAAWASENLLSRALADRDPVRVVAGKGLIGSAAAALAAALIGQRHVPLASALALIAIGGVGYGLSLRLYLGAQRLVGAGRTASVFAAAPFFGAMIAFGLGAPLPGLRLGVAALLMIAGVWLHVTERHSHRHRHETVEHEHLHTHDDGHHHDHVHEPMPSGPHSHWHRHGPVEHEHEHGEDLHHRHSH